jgi:hypothetical protein
MSVYLTRVYNPNPGWYRGDFHAHTTCSDGNLTPRNLSHLAAETGLDFLAITDHNDISAFDDFDRDHPRLVIPGVEVTLREGHFNVFGFAGNSAEAQQIFRGIVDVPLKQKHNLSLKHTHLKALLERISLAGYFVSLNHPLLEPWEWRDPLADIGWFGGIELVNDPSYGENYRLNTATLRLWSAWLNAGYRCTGLGGSDFHSLEPSDNPNCLSRLNLPLTYVYAEELSAMAILEGLRQRRAYISLGPQVELTLKLEGRAYAMGEDVGLVHNPGRLSARVWDCRDKARLILVRNGQALARADVQNGASEIEVEIPANEAPVQAWYRVDVLDAASQILAVSNPIFAGPHGNPAPRTYGSFAELLLS